MRHDGGERGLVVAGLDSVEREGGGAAERVRKERGSSWERDSGRRGEGASKEAELGLAEEAGAPGGGSHCGGRRARFRVLGRKGPDSWLGPGFA